MSEWLAKNGKIVGVIAAVVFAIAGAFMHADVKALVCGGELPTLPAAK